MSTLHDRLTDLAEEAPVGVPDPGLWDRGRRIARRRRAGTVVIAAVVVVLLGSLGAVAWRQPSREPLPVGPTEGTMRLPDRFYDPSGRVRSTAEDGPLGRLVAVVGSSDGVVGVSATTGEYRALDLPGWSDQDDLLQSSDVAISADGRWVGYWYVEDGRVEGVAAYDAVTGEVTRHDDPSDFGLSPNGFAWVGDRLWYSAFDFDDDTHTSARGHGSTLWTVADDQVAELPLADSPGFGTHTTTSTSVVEPDGHGFEIYTPDGTRPQKLGVDPSFSGEVAVAPDEDRYAVVLDPAPNEMRSGERHPLAVLTPNEYGGTSVRKVPVLRTSSVIAWRDPHHVVVWTDGHAAYEVVDIKTGETADLTTPGPQFTPGLTVAADAWSAPTYHAPPLPPPSHDGLVASGAAVVVLGGLGALLWWRRRARA